MPLSAFQEEWCRSILTKMMQRPIASPFSKHGSASLLSQSPDPPAPQRGPPDLNTILDNLTNKRYDSVIQWGLDIRNVIGELTRRASNEAFFQMAADLLGWFEVRFHRFPQNPEEEWLRRLAKARKKAASLIKKAPSMSHRSA
jgi:hypothetical protein